jgi:DNA-directed RNA polymerase specialized sigma24 family protein
MAACEGLEWQALNGPLDDCGDDFEGEVFHLRLCGYTVKECAHRFDLSISEVLSIIRRAEED